MDIWKDLSIKVNAAKAKWLSVYIYRKIILQNKEDLTLLFCIRLIKFRYYLAGLSCTDETGRTKLGFQKYADK